MHGGGKITTTSLATTTSAAKRPRATNAETIFASEHKDQIMQAMAEKRAQEGTTTEQNLPEYNRIKRDLFLELSADDRAKYEEKAITQNSSVQTKPASSHIYE